MADAQKQVKPVTKNGKPVVMGRGKPFTDTGRQILKPGTRKGVADSSVDINSRDMLMEILNANFMHRNKDRSPGIGEQAIEMALGGLFGGTNPQVRPPSPREEDRPSTGGRRRG